MAVAFPLRTARLLIEAMGAGDAADFARYRSEPEVARYQLADAERVTAANPDGWPAAGEWLQLAIREGGTLLGDIAVQPLDDPMQLDTVEIGVTLATERPDARPIARPSPRCCSSPDRNWD